MSGTVTKLNLDQIQDPIVRKNFELLQEMLTTDMQLRGFVHVDIYVDKAVTNYRVKHGLGYVPLDFIRTKFQGPGNIYLNYDKFDEQFMDLTTTGECRLRGFVGSYQGDSNGA